ncbi:MAG TPA: ERF family protein [Burkholderiales bacterium]|nr:ERF family protein [Burkholderiales bacterium]
MNAETKITAAPAVYQAIAAVMHDMASEGIGKNRKNQQQNYNFRGIDDVYNALAPVLAKHQLCMLPRVLSREVVERQTKSGGALFYTTVEAEFDLVSAVDGSTHTIRTVGEAMDSADKSSNKAMSAAYKYAAMQAFCIPTEGDNDADAHTPDVAARPAQPRMATDEQRDLIQTLASAVHKPIKDICDAYAKSTGREVASLKALTADEAESVIARLQAMSAKEPAHA